MVDGQEFFGGDVLMAIQNLPAGIVDKLQVVDDYGDKARLTGVRSGDAAKVLNIRLRTDKRDGQFGRLEAATGADGKYVGNLFANDLHGQCQTGVRADVSNNNPAGNDPAHSGGINYANQWGPRWGLASNINTSAQSPQFIVTTATNSYYPGEVLQQLQYNHNDASSGQTSGNGRLTYKPDPYTLLRLTTSGGRQSSTSQLTSNFSTLEQESAYSKATMGNSSNLAQIIGHSFDSDLYYEKTYPTNRQRFSVDANMGYAGSHSTNNSESTALIVSDSNASNSYLRIVTTNDVKSWNATLRANYFVPFGPTAFLELGYGAKTSISRSSFLTQEADSVGVPVVPVDSLSQNTILSIMAQNIHAGYTAKIHEVDFAATMEAQPGELKGSAYAKGDLTTYTYFSVIPFLQAAWNLDKIRRLRVGYGGQPVLPSLQQLSPITNLSNPLYPVTGNPDLKQSYTHHVYLNYELADMKITKFFGYGVGLDYSITTHSIVSDRSTVKDSSQAIQATTFLNAGSTSNLSANYHLTLPALFRGKFRVMLAGSVSRGSTITMTNGLQYPTQSWTGAPSAHLQVFIPERMETDLSASYSVTKSTYQASISPANTFRSASIDLSSRHYFLRKWVLNYHFVQSYIGSGASMLTLPPSLIGSIQRQFLPHNSASVSLTGFNLFNQGIATGEGFSATTITHTSSKMTGRYLLLAMQVKLQRFKHF